MALDPSKYLGEHKVAAGETLSALAQRYYGTGDQAHWMLIYNENRDVIGSNPELIRTGQSLRIPRLQTTGPVIANHTVVGGDTLREISQRYYGTPDQWMAIYQANRDVIGPNPDLLRPGQLLKIPSVTGPTPKPEPKPDPGGEFLGTYTVKAGDTLSSIAQRYYGSAEAKFWKAIHRANKDVIGKDYRKILAGQVLKIPKL
jgi:nucleoid-associated protein YgaU